jgi:hypothetical protein
MNTINTSEDILNFAEGDNSKLPSGLNILTILTITGCVFELYSDIKNFLKGNENLAKLQDAQSKLDTMPSWARKFVGPDILEMAQKGLENRVPILIISLLSIGLCIFGAIEMRKFKKQGYQLWLVGELLPIVGSFIFLGTIYFTTVLAWFLIFPLIFIILYTTQRKYLIR